MLVPRRTRRVNLPPVDSGSTINIMGDAAANNFSVPNFSYTIAQYHAESVGSGTVTDYSDTGYSITTTAGSLQTFTPFYSGSWSVRLHPVQPPSLYRGSFLIVEANSGFAFGADDFTIEAYVYFVIIKINGDKDPIIGDWRARGASPAFNFLLYADYDGNRATKGALNFATSVGTYTVGYEFIPGRWYHIAVSREASVLKFFVNGVKVTVGTNAVTLGSDYIVTESIANTNPPIIGAHGDAFDYVGNPRDCVDGYISNLRVVKGTAVYTTDFVVSSRDLPVVPNTVFLGLQSAQLVDNSGNNLKITNPSDNGTTEPPEFGGWVNTAYAGAWSPALVTFSPFSTTRVRSPRLDGGSIDAAPNITLSNSIDWQFRNNQFSVEAWIYLTEMPLTITSGVIFSYFSSPFGCRLTFGNNQVQFAYNSLTISTAANTIGIYQWCHIAVVNNGSNIIVYINGILQASITSVYINDYSGSLTILNNFSGYASGFRIVNGSTPYSSNFTVPIAPPQKIPNTKLLLTFEEVAAVDNTTNTYADGAVLSTAQKAYGSSSFYFNGSTYTELKSNLLKYIVTTQDYYSTNFGAYYATEPWALSLRFYPLDVTTQRGLVGIGGVPSTTYGIGVYINANRGLTVTTGSRLISSSMSSGNTSNNILLANTWHTLTISHNGGGTVSVFVEGGASNGQRQTPIFPYLPQPEDTHIYIGQGYVVSGSALIFSNSFYGYIDEVKLVKGTASAPGTIGSVGWPDK